MSYNEAFVQKVLEGFEKSAMGGHKTTVGDRRIISHSKKDDGWYHPVTIGIQRDRRKGMPEALNHPLSGDEVSSIVDSGLGTESGGHLYIDIRHFKRKE